MKRVFIGVLFFVLIANISLQAQERFSPDIASLARYETPEWFRDAKFGIFIHWGPYAVPAYRKEWYPMWMYNERRREHKYHVENYGHPSVFGYKDFIPMFKAENWNPDSWAKLFVETGAKYVIPVAEHHDGFPMYDCSFTKYNSVNMGPKRDVVWELLAACKDVGLKTGVSSHRAYHWVYYKPQKNHDTSNPAYSELYWKPRTTRWPDKEFVDDWYLRTMELAVKYKPDIFWFDFFLEQPEFHDARYQFASNYYNLSRSWDKEVVLQYKYDIYDPSIGLLDIERGKLSGIQRNPWQTDTSVSIRGWSYLKDAEYKSPRLLVHDLIDIVSKNGNLLLNIGPKPDGIIPQEQQDLLLAIGQWLKVNGEAIYGTRPWVSFGEGPTQTTEGAHQEGKNKEATEEDYRFVVKGKTLYATCMGWPAKDFLINSLGMNSTKKFNIKIKDVSMLGSDESLKWAQNTDHLKISKPSTKPCKYAYTLKIEAEGLEGQMALYHQNLPKEPTAMYCFPANSMREEIGYGVLNGNLNNWEKDTVIRWNMKVHEAGTYSIDVTQRNPELDRYIMKVNGLEFKNSDQNTRKEFQQVNLGSVTFKKSGIYPIALETDPAYEWKKKYSLKQIKFTKQR